MPTDDGVAAMHAMGAYVYELTAKKRRHPADDMLSGLIAAEVDDGEGGTTRLDDVEIAGFATLLGGAGAETVTKLLGNAFVLFARNPEQYRKVVEDPERIPNAVEEILRILPPSQYQGRYSATRQHRSTARRSRPATRCCSSPAPRCATRPPSSVPTSSTSTGRPCSRSGSGTASTAASAPRWPGSRPHRHRGDGDPLARVLDRRGRPAAGAHEQRRRLHERAGHGGLDPLTATSPAHATSAPNGSGPRVGSTTVRPPCQVSSSA